MSLVRKITYDAHEVFTVNFGGLEVVNVIQTEIFEVDSRDTHVELAPASASII